MLLPLRSNNRTVIGVRGGEFLLNGTPRFLLGIQLFWSLGSLSKTLFKQISISSKNVDSIGFASGRPGQHLRPMSPQWIKVDIFVNPS